MGRAARSRTASASTWSSRASSPCGTLPGPPDPLALAHVEASIPEHGAVGVPVDAVISLRFSGPVPVEQLQSSSVILAGPEGPRAVRVVPAEEGRLLFITPVTPLDGGVTYALSPSAAVDAGGVFARFGPVAFSTAAPAPHRPGTSREATGPTSPDGSPRPSGAIGGGDPGAGPAGEGGGHRGGDARRAGTDGVKPGLTVESIDPPAPATAPTPGGDAWDGDSVDLSTGIFVHRKTDLYVDGAIPIALTRTYRSGDSGARPFGIGSSHPYQIFLSATAPYQEASLILADGSAIRYVRTSPGTDVLGAVFEHVGTPTAFYGSTLTGAGFWNARDRRRQGLSARRQRPATAGRRSIRPRGGSAPGRPHAWAGNRRGHACHLAHASPHAQRPVDHLRRTTR